MLGSIGVRIGALHWASSTVYSLAGAALAVADIDHDGDVEIVHHGYVFDHTGTLLWSAPASQEDYVNTIADLDGDDNMEVILARVRGRHGGRARARRLANGAATTNNSARRTTPRAHW